MRNSAIALAITAVAAIPALANDSTAELTTGGLTFVHNDNIEMTSEDLAISAKEISVRYRFFNKSEEDVTVLVAFPMPDVTIESADQGIAVPSDDPVNLLAFVTTVNGKPAATNVEQRVIAMGVDRTQLLRSLGIPLAPHLPATAEALDRLPPEKWDELLRIGVAEIDEDDAGQGMKRHLAPRWTLQTTYYWEQTFPSRVETTIEHRYKPSVGSSVQTGLGAPDATKESWYDDYKEKYCFDFEFLAAVERARKAANAKSGAPFSEERVDYILKTGANWSGPIRQFRLVVDKGAADNLVSFCGEDAKKIDDTQLELKKTDYTPDGNLSVLILKKVQTP
jgi:hypothetical protein